MIICFPHKPGHGGPGSFQIRLEQALLSKGWHVSYAGDTVAPDLVFVVGGTKRLGWLLKMKLKGVPIVHRLDGLAWLHRGQGWKNLLYGEWGNFLFKFIHGVLATHVVYQSEFVKQWWEKTSWFKKENYSIIHNGVDLYEFKPNTKPNKGINILCVEGLIDYSPYAVELLNYLQESLVEQTDYNSLIVCGGFYRKENMERLNANIDYRGHIDREKLPSIYKNAVYLSLDVNAACPNTVVEALACGLPVVGYDTGALKELVGEAGKVVEYCGNPWDREIPDFDVLKMGFIDVLDKYKEYSEKAKILSARKYSLEKMTGSYLEVLNSLVKKNSI